MSLYRVLLEIPNFSMTPDILQAEKGESFQRKLLNIFNDGRSSKGKGCGDLPENSAVGTVGTEARLLGPRRDPAAERLQTA